MGIRREEFRTALLPGQNQQEADQALDMLLSRNTFVRSGTVFALPEHAISFTPRQQALLEGLQTRFEEARFSPPEKSALLAEFAKEKEFPRVLDYLLDQGSLTPVSPDILFLTKDLAQAQQAFLQLQQQHGEVTLADFRDALSTSRKYALAILEYWDRKGITRKTGEARKMAIS
jgi:selenocysteine-specific elongation factor